MAHYRRGLFGWLALLLFGERCITEMCWVRPDPRCKAGLCPEHCGRIYNCNGVCRRVPSREEVERELLENIAKL